MGGIFKINSTDLSCINFLHENLISKRTKTKDITSDNDFGYRYSTRYKSNGHLFAQNAGADLQTILALGNWSSNTTYLIFLINILLIKNYLNFFGLHFH